MEIFHYDQEIKEEIERLFEGNKCTVCMKDFVKLGNRRQHIIYKHSEYVEEIKSAANAAMTSNNVVTKNCVNEINCKKKHYESSLSELRLVPISNLTKQINLSRFQEELFAMQDILDDKEANEDMETNQIQTIFKKYLERGRRNEGRKEIKEDMVEDVRITEEDCKNKDTDEEIEENGRKKEHDEEDRLKDNLCLELDDDSEEEYGAEEMKDEEDRMENLRWYLMEETVSPK